MKKKEQIASVVKVINRLMKKGCTRFEPEVCGNCYEAEQAITRIIKARL